MSADGERSALKKKGTRSTSVRWRIRRRRRASAERDWKGTMRAGQGSGTVGVFTKSHMDKFHLNIHMHGKKIKVIQITKFCKYDYF